MMTRDIQHHWDIIIKNIVTRNVIPAGAHNINPDIVTWYIIRLNDVTIICKMYSADIVLENLVTDNPITILISLSTSGTSLNWIVNSYIIIWKNITRNVVVKTVL
jgi:hypothetical protein